MYPSVASDRRDIQAVLKEVEAGLPNESKRFDCARKNSDFYEGRQENYIQYQDAEQVYDHQFRPKRYSQLLHAAIGYLTQHLYAYGPQRRLTNASTAIDKWLQAVYAGNAIDALFHQADKFAHLNDVACFQVAAVGGPGDLPMMDDEEPGEADAMGIDLGLDTPIKIHLLGAEEFAVWCEPSDPLKPWCVCTISRFDETRRYQVWTKEEYWTYYTRKASETKTGGRVASRAPNESGENPYGILPFAFVFNDIPTRDFWTPGPGTPLRKANHWVINQLSALANSIRFYGSPMGYARNVRPDWRPIIRPGSFTHLPASPSGTSTGLEPFIGYLQANLDIAGILSDLDSFVDHTLEEHQIPPAVFRMDVNNNTSGVAILLRQAPLITRARNRRLPFGRYEAALARVILAVGGAYYQRRDIWEAAHVGRLVITWPEIEIPLPGTDKDTADQWELDKGITSKIQILMRRRGLTRDQAIAELKQIQKDNEELEAMGVNQPSPAALMGPGGVPAIEEIESKEEEDTEVVNPELEAKE